jgi:hypothetical protein
LTYANEETLRKALREPFPHEQIGKLPRTQKRPELDFVGHAAVTDRLNRVAPDWHYTVDENFMWETRYWIKGTMTIGEVSRPEYGDGDDPKEAIGNFIRRAAMRFGVAIDLWSREELSGPVEPTTRKSSRAGGMAGTDGGAAYGEGAAPPNVEEAPALSSQVRTLLRLADDLRWGDAEIAEGVAEVFPGITSLKHLTQLQARELIPLWESAARAMRLTEEQVQEIRTLASLADAKTVAERLFSRKVPNLHVLTSPEGRMLIESLRAVKAEMAT